MQTENRWKTAANLNLLLGSTHPPQHIEREHASAPDDIDARNTVGFKDTLYCNRQDGFYSGTRQRLAEYYRFMLSKISLWDVETHLDPVRGEETSGESQPSAVKEEPLDELGAASYDGDMGAPPPLQYRAMGILTQVNDPSALGEESLLPWEFFPITDIHDEESFVEPICALTKEVAPVGGILNLDAANEEEGVGVATSAPNLEGTMNPHTFNRRGQERISLYTRLVPQFTGLYPGMALGVVGEPFKRSSTGALTGVLVRRFVLPPRPMFPWGPERPLLSNHATPIPVRVQFCSGPFPRREINHILAAVTLSALRRGANLLIIGGPLLKGVEDFEKDMMNVLNRTFDELLNSYVDTIAEKIADYYAASGSKDQRRRLKVILVPHRDDVTQIPAIPTTMYSLEDDEDVWVRSNPCRVSVNGVHFGVCNEDVVGDMRDRMVERWPAEEGSLRRVVETIVQSRLYAPVCELPAVKHEMRHLHALRMDLTPGEMATDAKSPHVWDSFRHILPKQEAEDADGETRREAKRVKRESESISPSRMETAAECLPHVMFLPSTRPHFAIVTHRSVRDTTTGTFRDESELDSTDTATGVLVVNQEIWSKRSSPRFELRVAEVTVPDSALVISRGASEANGVACGVLHFTNTV